ncbi:TPA: hypothetical protein DF272_00005 [Candidatus Falkowbacteria bacterium]|nr:hypothetical protein [Candidatus Falkowbacteria bacterium]
MSSPQYERFQRVMMAWIKDFERFFDQALAHGVNPTHYPEWSRLKERLRLVYLRVEDHKARLRALISPDVIHDSYDKLVEHERSFGEILHSLISAITDLKHFLLRIR